MTEADQGKKPSSRLVRIVGGGQPPRHSEHRHTDAGLSQTIDGSSVKQIEPSAAFKWWRDYIKDPTEKKG